MLDEAVKKEIEILSKIELDKTIKRLVSQVLEKIQILVHYFFLEYQLREFIYLNY